MCNYIKFATYQILFFLSSIFKLNKIKNHPNQFTDKQIYNFLHNHAKKSLDLVDINVNILGRDKIPNEPVLFVANHASMLDSFILISSINKPIGCVIAAEGLWKSVPIVSTWTRLIKCVYIDRKNNRSGMKSIVESSNNIKNGYSMAVFPEGDLTWIKDPNAYISEFRPGALKIAYKANCSIVPFVIKNSRDTYKGYEPIGKINSLDVEVEFLDPIYEHITNPKLKTAHLGELIQNKMIDKIKEYEA